MYQPFNHKHKFNEKSLPKFNIKFKSSPVNIQVRKMHKFSDGGK